MFLWYVFISQFYAKRFNYYLGAQLLFQSRKVDSTEKGEAALKKTLNNGEAVEKFQEMIINQGVDENKAKALCAKGADMWTILPKSKFTTTIESPKSGIDIFHFFSSDILFFNGINSEHSEFDSSGN